jgi:hypothetical protein
LVGDTTRARALLAEAAGKTLADPFSLKVWDTLAEALVVARGGRPEEALRILQPIARFESSRAFGLVPAAVRGVISSWAGRHAEATGAFDEVVRRRMVASAPWLAFSAFGRARALRDAGDRSRSLAAYDTFLASWKDADRDLPLLKAVERERQAVR